MSRLAALVRQSIADPRPDGVLLGAFLADRDEAAFAELVRRHAPLVWGACRRGLPDLADAEDAFQATFLVLVRRANRLTDSATVGPWLYRVAAWTAGNLRRKNARRLARRRELSDAVPDSRPTLEPSFDLDAALLALPERYRAALVLCCLEGLTHREAAGRLGCAEGTVSSLVSRGLSKLRARLAGRDPAAALAIAAAVLVPNSLSAVAARSAAAFRILSAAASPAVAELTEGVLRMFWVPKATAAGLVSVAVLTLGLGVGLTGKPTGPTAAADPPAKPADPPKPLTDVRERELERLIDDLRAQQMRAEEERKQAEQRAKEAEIKATAAFVKLAEALTQREALAIAAGTSLVLNVMANKDAPVTLSEVRKDGRTAWEVTFRPAKPGDLSELRAYLTRAASDKTVARKVSIVADAEVKAQLVKDVTKVCADAGFTIGTAEVKSRDSGRGKPVIKQRSPRNVQADVPKDGEIINNSQGMAISIPVGGVVRLNLSEGKFVGIGADVHPTPGNAEGDIIWTSLSGEGLFTMRGQKPGELLLTLSDDLRAVYSIRVTVTAKGPGQ